MSDIFKWYIVILIYSPSSIKQHFAGRKYLKIYEKIILKFVVFFIVLARYGTIVTLVGE
jgi:hypothetical protein